LGAIFSLSERGAIVTGASRGIGWAIADGLARAGATVVAVARADRPEKALPKGCEYRSCDVRNEAHLAAVVGDLVALAGRVDVLVNAAGITRSGDTIDDFDETIATNLRAPLLAVRAVLPAMTAARRGAIINVTSLGAHRGFPGNPGYVAAKGGLSQLTRALAYDHGASGIRCNNLVPGYITTAMTAGSYADPVQNVRRRSHTMLGRWGEPADLVGAAIFLASDASSYITGQDIVVDGGWLAKGLV
jgi:NAD(P)-dependent dehydrogenase (short-subunit alcohol dehydrogenase family)